MLKKLLLSLTLLFLLSSKGFSATPFYITVKASGGDFTTMLNAESALDEDITAADIKVFSFDASAGKIPNGTAVSTDGGSTTGVCVVQSVGGQILIKTISGGTFDDNDVVTDGTNTVTLSGSGDSPIVDVEIFNNQSLAMSFFGGAGNLDNYFRYHGSESSWDGTAANAISLSPSSTTTGMINIRIYGVHLDHFYTEVTSDDGQALISMESNASMFNKLNHFIFKRNSETYNNPIYAIKCSGGTDHSGTWHDLVFLGYWSSSTATVTFRGDDVNESYWYNITFDGAKIGTPEDLSYSALQFDSTGSRAGHVKNILIKNYQDNTALSANVDNNDLDYCYFSGTDADCSGENSATSQTISVDSNGFLQVGSAGIDKGLDLGANFSVDITGYTRTGTWDIGADEYVASGGAARRMIMIQ